MLGFNIESKYLKEVAISGPAKNSRQKNTR
jgi:hypothetical protein